MRANLRLLRYRSRTLPQGLLLLLLMLYGAGFAHAETRHPLGAPTTAPAEREAPVPSNGPDVPRPLAEPPGPLEHLTTWMLQTQRQLHRDLTEGLHALRDAPTAQTTGALILVSLLYGIFHAAGPGHGKAVISTYLLTQPQNLRRGIALSAAAALAQGITAILLVGVLVGLLGWLARDTLGHVRHMETASFVLIALLGLWLMGRGLRHLWHPPRAARRADDADHPHDHEPGHCGCGTPHHVDPSPSGTWWGTVLAVGIRPCSGAVLMMAVSTALGMAWAGITAVLAMSVGTAVTVSLLALLAVSARDWTRRRLSATRVQYLAFAGPALGLLGGGIITLIGISLVHGALRYQPVAHPLGL
ncbi:MAG: nickel/cobalt transporter [Pseudomonadota bacterium]